MHSADYDYARYLSVCLYVRLSDAGIPSKRHNISSNCFHYRVASHTAVVFAVPNVIAVFRRGAPVTGASNAGGMTFDQYLAIYQERYMIRP